MTGQALACAGAEGKHLARIGCKALGNFIQAFGRSPGSILSVVSASPDTIEYGELWPHFCFYDQAAAKQETTTQVQDTLFNAAEGERQQLNMNGASSIPHTTLARAWQPLLRCLNESEDLQVEFDADESLKTKVGDSFLATVRHRGRELVLINQDSRDASRAVRSCQAAGKACLSLKPDLGQNLLNAVLSKLR